MDAKVRSRGRGKIKWRWSRSLLDRCWCGFALVWVGVGVARCDETGLWSLDWGSIWGLIWALSLSLSVWVRKWFEVKIFTSNHFRVKLTKTHDQLKIFFRKFIFHAQPNTHIYGKVFPKMIWSQNKHSLSSLILKSVILADNFVQMLLKILVGYWS